MAFSADPARHTHDLTKLVYLFLHIMPAHLDLPIVESFPH